MKFREKLADWISGGALSIAEDGLRRNMVEKQRLWGVIRDIQAYTAPQKSGTARKVTRMCEEALK